MVTANIIKFISGAFLSVSLLFGPGQIAQAPQVETPDPLLGVNISALADFRTSLASGIDESTTTMTLVSFSSGSDSLLVGDTYGFKIGGREYVVGTASAGNRITGMTRGLSRQTATTSVTAYRLPWGRGTAVEITDAPIIIDHSNKIKGISGFDSIIRYASNNSFASDTDIVSKKYVDDTAFSGAGVVDSSETARGVVEIATSLETASSTTNGASGRLAIPASLATSTYNSATAGLKVVVTQNNGKIDNNFLSTTSLGLFAPYFGSGVDGSVTIAANSTTTLTRDMYYSDLVVNGGLVTNGYRVFVSGTISGTGFITPIYAPSAGSNGSGTTGGAGGARMVSSGYLLNNAGTAGGNTSVNGGAVGNSTSASTTNGFQTAGNGGNGGAGGKSSSTGGDRVGGCQSGAIDASTCRGGQVAYSSYYGIESWSTFQVADYSTTTQYQIVLRTTSGGAGGGGGGVVATGNNGGGGGGGGASGGITVISARTWAGSFTLYARGGNGGNGANQAGSNCGGGGGGGGGAGGIIAMIYGTKTWTGTSVVTGGTGGTGGTGDAGNGSSGNNGGTGVLFQIDISNLIR